jgi:hypothetical protein
MLSDAGFTIWVRPRDYTVTYVLFNDCQSHLLQSPQKLHTDVELSP